MNENRVEQAAALAEEGTSLYRSRAHLKAADSFSRSAQLYLELGETSLAAEMRNNQAVALLMARKPAQALQVVRGTEEAFRAAGDSQKEAMALANQATALQDLGEKEQAIEFFSRAAELFKAAGKDEMYLQTMQSVSALKLKTRNLTGALASMQVGLDALEKPTWRQKLLRNLLSIPDQLLRR